MFGIISLASFALAVAAMVLIFLAYFKNRSLLIPYIIFFVCIIAFGASTFLFVTGPGETAEDPSSQPSGPAPSSSFEIPSASPSEAPADENTSPPAAPSEPSETSSPVPTSSGDLLSIGDNTTLGDWGILVTDFYYTDQINQSAYTYYYPDEGNQYAVATVRVSNNGTEAATFLPTPGLANDVRAKIYYAGKYEYTATYLLGVNEDLHNATMNPLTAKEGIIVFSVPDAVVTGQESLSLVFSAGRNDITFSLR